MIRLPWRKDASSTPPVEHQPESDGPAAGGVLGERGAPMGTGARSLQSRVSSLLAAGLMASVGAGMLAWYYAEALSRPAAAHGRPPLSVPQAAGSGMTLPPFGPISRPSDEAGISVAARGTPVRASQSSGESAAGQTAPASALAVQALLEPHLARYAGGLARGYGPPPQPSPRERALERRLSGDVFAGAGGSLRSGETGGGVNVPESPSGSAPGAQEGPSSRGTSGGALDTLLRPSVLQATRARLLPTQRLLLPKGTFIDCTLETAIDSTLPGMTTCITATDTFSADGTVVLLERGTKLIGQTRGEVRQGAARVFVLWTEARTPAGVVVRLDSPGTDSLGRSGLEGEVNRHFWQRFGAAALVSTIDGAVQSQVQSSSRGGTVVLDPTASEDVLTEILRSTVNIPPTIRVRNGARIQVLVARDVDFRTVYELEPR